VEVYDVNAMFCFTMTMGLTAFVMAWVIIVLAVKGWALRKEARASAGAVFECIDSASWLAQRVTH